MLGTLCLNISASNRNLPVPVRVAVSSALFAFQLILALSKENGVWVVL